MPTFLTKLPLWAFYPVGVVAMFGGFAIIGAIPGLTQVNDPTTVPWNEVPPWALVSIMIVVGAAEALLWTVAFTEAFARVLRAPVTGAICGVFAYGLLCHLSRGSLGILAASWIGTVLAAEYVAMRTRSRRAAVLNAICIKWTFMVYAHVMLVGGVDLRV